MAYHSLFTLDQVWVQISARSFKSMRNYEIPLFISAYFLLNRNYANCFVPKLLHLVG